MTATVLKRLGRGGQHARDPAGPLPALAVAAPASLCPPLGVVPPLGAAPAQVRRWFDSSIVVDRAAYDDTLETARAMGESFARLAKADKHAARLPRRRRRLMPCPACPRRPPTSWRSWRPNAGAGLSAIIDLRRAAIRYLHHLAGCPVPTAEAVVGETLAGIRRDAARWGEFPVKRNSPPRLACCARSWLRSATICRGCMTARCCWSASPARCASPRSRRSGRSTWSRPRASSASPCRCRRATATARTSPWRCRSAPPCSARCAASPLAGRRLHHRGPAVPQHLAAAHGRDAGDRRAHRRAHRPGPHRRRLRCRSPRRPQPEMRCPDHRHGLWGASQSVEAARPGQELRRDGPPTSSTTICSRAIRSAACSDRRPCPLPRPDADPRPSAAAVATLNADQFFAKGRRPCPQIRGRGQPGRGPFCHPVLAEMNDSRRDFEEQRDCPRTARALAAEAMRDNRLVSMLPFLLVAFLPDRPWGWTLLGSDSRRMIWSGAARVPRRPTLSD